MKLLQQIQSDSTSTLFLYGAIMFANIDYIGIMDYVIKAILGGAIWCAFKLLQDYYSIKVQNTARSRMEKKQRIKEDQHKEENEDK